MTLMFRMVEFERMAFASYRKAHPDQWRGVHGLWELVREASAAGELALAREDILLFGPPHERDLSVNRTRVTGVLGTSVWDLTQAEWRARRQMRQIAAFLRKYVPGFEHSQGKGTLLRQLPSGESYDIPLRCLLPQRVDRLTVAGRCISGTHEAHSSYRVMPIAMATGQAAATCRGSSGVRAPRS